LYKSTSTNCERVILYNTAKVGGAKDCLLGRERVFSCQSNAISKVAVSDWLDCIGGLLVVMLCVVTVTLVDWQLRKIKHGQPTVYFEQICVCCWL